MKQQAPKVARDDEGLARLRARGVTRALTLWPEWGVAFTMLDKRVENRPMPPLRNMIGQRIAFHMGKHVGGRASAYDDGLRAVLLGAATGGLSHGGEDPVETIRRTGFKLEQEWRYPTDRPDLAPDNRGADQALRAYVQQTGSTEYGRLYKLTPQGGPTTIIRVPQDIVTSAITFTAVIGGFHPPTPDPKIPWQVGTPRGEEPSYAWILEDLEVLDTPVTCPGMQGVWTL